jgi:hypothetical protein
MSRPIERELRQKRRPGRDAVTHNNPAVTVPRVIRIMRNRIAVATVLSVALAIAAFVSGQLASGVSHKTISIGVEFDKPGLGLMEKDGKPVGFDVDMATYIARYLGYSPDDIRWVDAPSSNREKLVDDGKADFGGREGHRSGRHKPRHGPDHRFRRAHRLG